MFALEHSYEVARSCLADAVFVANEREYHGVVALVARAQDALEAIGKLAGIDRSALLDYPVVTDDEGEAPTPAQEAEIERLRDLVRRLAGSLDVAVNVLKASVFYPGPPQNPPHHHLNGVDITALLDEAREVLGEEEP